MARHKNGTRRVTKTKARKLATRAVTVLALAASAGMGAQAVAAPAGPVPGTPGLGPLGTAAVHGDIYSTDTIPGVGPGPNPAVAASIPGGTCSSVFVGADGVPVALCTAYVGTDPVEFTPPTVVAFDPSTAQPVARVQLAKGALLGGVYGYMDDQDRVVVADGNHVLHAIGHVRDDAGRWSMTDDVLADLAPALEPGDHITGLAPGTDGRIWFVTVDSRVGTVRPGKPDSLRILDLPEAAGSPAGERVSNGITVRPGGASVMTSHALYEITQDDGGAPQLAWRRDYERGGARHPGMLAHGSGSTPTYFGPHGDDFVAYLDAADRSTLFVLDRASGEVRCEMPAFATTLDPDTAAADGRLIDGPAQSENSPIALESSGGGEWSIIIANTYGYEYMPMAVDGPAVPAHAPYRGGMTSVVTDGSGCHRAWTQHSRTATLPKATTDDRLIHGLAYGDLPEVPAQSAELPGAGEAERGLGDAVSTGLAQKVGPVFYTAVDADTGEEVIRSKVGDAPVDEPMELTGTVAPSTDGGPGVYWQATMGRMLRIGAA
ncbi:MAG TPA: hypothetical protein K8V11_00925 [Dietzia timorensis]|uniref:Secreted protein n=1 Tax=Dietzia timorensis TaxID=499555 RepID=A0A921JY74_9ACTN|nr:hypothetical protein [Dietzia timorensis]HJE89556.1 hypothetical protein [Dietzia timorensis]